MPLLGSSFSDDEGERDQQLRELVVSCVPFFSGVSASPDALEVKVLVGGITNQLYRVTCPAALAATSVQDSSSSASSCTHSVVVRVFGKETEKIISRDAEQYWQSKFLRTFGKFDSALVYEFLDGYRPLEYPEMSNPKYFGHVARELARFHDRASRFHTFARSHQGPNFLQVFVGQWVPMVLDVEEVKNRVVGMKGDAAGFEVYQSLGWSPAAGGMSALQRELAELGSVLQSLKDELPLGVSHNDLLSGNIMVRHSSPEGCEGDDGLVESVRLIDFEYARVNFTYYDIANHICEWAGFECEYDQYFPSKDIIKRFLLEYFEESASLVVGLGVPSDGELGRAADIVLYFTLYSHLVWAVWAVIQGMHSVIDFPYLPYSTLRWAQYHRTKAEILAALTTATSPKAHPK